jgi:hypothetical protein
MKERARELKAETRSSRAKGEGERELLAKIAEMPEPDRAMATRIHAIIKAAAPGLSPKTYTLGFSDAANLDDGAMLRPRLRSGSWPPPRKRGSAGWYSGRPAEGSEPYRERG